LGVGNQQLGVRNERLILMDFPQIYESSEESPASGDDFSAGELEFYRTSGFKSSSGWTVAVGDFILRHGSDRNPAGATGC
jgi:hypothetical protein